MTAPAFERREKERGPDGRYSTASRDSLRTYRIAAQLRAREEREREERERTASARAVPRKMRSVPQDALDGETLESIIDFTRHAEQGDVGSMKNFLVTIDPSVTFSVDEPRFSVPPKRTAYADDGPGAKRLEQINNLTPVGNSWLLEASVVASFDRSYPRADNLPVSYRIDRGASRRPLPFIQNSGPTPKLLTTDCVFDGTTVYGDANFYLDNANAILCDTAEDVHGYIAALSFNRPERLSGKHRHIHEMLLLGARRNFSSIEDANTLIKVARSTLLTAFALTKNVPLIHWAFVDTGANKNRTGFYLTLRSSSAKGYEYVVDLSQAGTHTFYSPVLFPAIANAPLRRDVDAVVERQFAAALGFSKDVLSAETVAAIARTENHRAISQLSESRRTAYARHHFAA